VHEETQAHYDRLAPVYDQNWAYSPEFLEWMSQGILARPWYARIRLSMLALAWLGRESAGHKGGLAPATNT
jgi:hypothetical protein